MSNTQKIIIAIVVLIVVGLLVFFTPKREEATESAKTPTSEQPVDSTIVVPKTDASKKEVPPIKVDLGTVEFDSSTTGSAGSLQVTPVQQ